MSHCPNEHMPTFFPDSPKELIYVVDDQKMIAWTLCSILQHNGYQARWFTEARLLLNASVDCPPSLVVSDVMMPEMTGFELARALRLAQPACKILLFSGQANTPEEHSADAALAFEVLAKPVRPDVLLGRVANLLNSLSAYPESPYSPPKGRRHSDIGEPSDTQAQAANS